MTRFTCPYCNQPTTLTPPHYFSQEVYVGLESPSNLGKVYLRINAKSCPNSECNKLSLSLLLAHKEFNSAIREYQYLPIKRWSLLPESQAKALPEYIPTPIQEDYYEACRIRDLSPKASATLARRCLQGMIRDFWGISKGRLKDEIDALEVIVDPLTWEAIDSVRRVGNIGAHMEKDISVIIDVEVEESQLLIELIEQLIDDWYVVRYEKTQRLEKIKALAQEKQKS